MRKYKHFKPGCKYYICILLTDCHLKQDVRQLDNSTKPFWLRKFENPYRVGSSVVTFRMGMKAFRSELFQYSSGCSYVRSGKRFWFFLSAATVKLCIRYLRSFIVCNSFVVIRKICLQHALKVAGGTYSYNVYNILQYYLAGMHFWIAINATVDMFVCFNSFVSPQVCCADTCQIWMWFNGCSRYLWNIKIFLTDRLTHWRRMTHKCVGELDQHWLR